METVDREVRIEIDIVECIFTINGLSIQRVCNKNESKM